MPEPVKDKMSFKLDMQLDKDITLDQISAKINDHTKNGMIEMITIGGYFDTAKQKCLDNNINFKTWLFKNTKYNYMQSERLVKAFIAVTKYPQIIEHGKSSINQVLLDYQYYEDPDKFVAKETRIKQAQKSRSDLKKEIALLQKKYLEKELKYKEPGERVQELTLKLIEQEKTVSDLTKQINKYKEEVGIDRPSNTEKVRVDGFESGKDEFKTKILDWIRYKKKTNLKFTISELVDYINKI